MDVVIGEDLAHSADSRLDGGLIVRGGILAKQVLQDVRRHDGIAFDDLDQILADYDTAKVLVDLLVECGRFRRLVGCFFDGDSFREVVIDHAEIGVFSHLRLLRSQSQMRRSALGCT